MSMSSSLRVSLAFSTLGALVGAARGVDELELPSCY